MTQEKAEQLIKLASVYIDYNQMPLDDGPTYRGFQSWTGSQSLYLHLHEGSEGSAIYLSSLY